MATSVGGERFRQLSPAQFFAKYREIAGFSNPTRALYQTVRELVENALDATDSHGILPNIKILIKRDKENSNYYTVTVEDNGIGIPPQHVPNAFGRVLYSSKYVLRQTRGMFGLGIKAAIIYGQLTTGRPVEVITSTPGSRRIYYFKIRIDLKKNEPVILERGSWRKVRDWHGAIVSITIEGNWSLAKRYIKPYIERTAVITPYANIVFVTPDGEIIYYKRSIEKLPSPPKIVKPHPHGIDLEFLKDMILLYKDKSVREMLIDCFHGIGEKSSTGLLGLAGIPVDKKVGSLTEEEVKRLASVLRGIDRETLLQVRDSTRADNVVDMILEAYPWLKREYVKKAISMVNDILRDKIRNKKVPRLYQKTKPSELTMEHIEALVKALKRFYPRIKPPSPEALSPLGEEIIVEGLKRVYEPEFVTAITRKPASYQGHPFIVEVGIAYGGRIQKSDKPQLIRYANRIPLLFDESSDVAWKVVKPRDEKDRTGFDWRAYGVEFPAPLLVFTHICSTKIPFKGVGKESVADVQEIEYELRLALRDAARKLRLYLSRKKREEERRRKVFVLSRYIPEIARNLAVIARDSIGGDGLEPLLIEKLVDIVSKKTGIDKNRILEVVESVKIGG